MTIAIDSTTSTVTMSLSEYSALQAAINNARDALASSEARVKALEAARLDPLPVAHWNHGDTSWGSALLTQTANGAAGLLVATQSMGVDHTRRGFNGCDLRHHMDMKARNALCRALDPLITIKHKDRADLGVMVSEASLIVGKIIK